MTTTKKKKKKKKRKIPLVQVGQSLIVMRNNNKIQLLVAKCNQLSILPRCYLPEIARVM